MLIPMEYSKQFIPLTSSNPHDSKTDVILVLKTLINTMTKNAILQMRRTLNCKVTKIT